MAPILAAVCGGGAAAHADSKAAPPTRAYPESVRLERIVKVAAEPT
ncbi:MAG: hypothetical protein ABWJ97_05535 [Thermoproteus sp.]